MFKPMVEKYLKPYSNALVSITGHSSGAAMATLAAFGETDTNNGISQL